MSPVMGQGAVHLQQSMLGPEEAAQVGRVHCHHHGDVVHAARWKERLSEDVLVGNFFQHLKEKDNILCSKFPDS